LSTVWKITRGKNFIPLKAKLLHGNCISPEIKNTMLILQRNVLPVSLGAFLKLETAFFSHCSGNSQVSHCRCYEMKFILL
jgi:hypothetical protein